MKWHGNTKGFTLVEVVVSLTILSLVMVASISYMIFGTKSFDSGENQAKAQRNAQIVNEYITNELRNINGLFLKQYNDTAPDSYTKGVKLNNGVFKSFSKDSSNGINVDLVSNINIKITQNEKGYILGIEIYTVSNKQTYTINSEVLLNNLKPSGIQGMVPDGTKYTLNSRILYFY